VGLRAGLDIKATGKIVLSLPGIEPRSSGLPVRSQTLYLLSYPGSALTFKPTNLSSFMVNSTTQSVSNTI
jgi:hypothetical protein